VGVGRCCESREMLEQGSVVGLRRCCKSRACF
jgi:hypothetical protein